MKNNSTMLTSRKVLPEITFWINGADFGTTTFEDVKQQIKKIREAYDDGTCKLRILVKETP
jgi:hypothetical protein